MKTNFLKPIRYLKISLLVFLLFPHSSSYSQTGQTKIIGVFNDSIRRAGSLDGNLMFLNVDTLNTAALEIQIGKYSGDTSLLSQVISFDPVTIPGGWNYDRTGNKINIHLTAPVPAWTYYCSVRIQNLNSGWSVPHKFLSN